MKYIRNLLAVPFMLAVLFSLSGCQANLEWYVRNLSSRAVTLVLRYDTRTDKYRKNYLPLKNQKVDYKNEILKINYNTVALLTDSLPLQALNDSVYQLVIPAESTVELSQVIPTDYNYAKNVVFEFYQDGKIYAINTASVFEKHSNLHTTGSLTLKNLVYFDYPISKKVKW
jgi:hypothetical protein